MRFAVLLVLSTALAFGQGSTSRLVGVVTDASNAPVAKATVYLTNQGTGGTFSTTSTASGAYEFESLQPGKYRVAIEAAGFRKFDSVDNSVTIGQPTTVNVRLEVGSVSDSIEVTGAAQSVQTSSSANIGNIIEEKTIKDLPIVGTRGRNPLGLIDLQPGVIDTQAISGGAVVVFGARDRAINITLDGIDNNESSSGGSNFAPLRTNPDSLEEFRVITSNPSAEYGRSSGAQIAMITKSGTNSFHGSGFEFYRTPRFNANEWQNNYNSLGKKQFVQHIFGGAVGGPIIKNKTFFFVNVQALDALSTSAVTQTVYTAQARQGLYRYVPGGRNNPAGSPGASVDASGNVAPGVTVATYNIVANDPLRLGLDKTTQGLVNASPPPNVFNVGDGLNTAGFAFSAPSQERQHDVTFKVDHIINGKNTVYARISFGQQNTNCDSANGGLSLFPGTPCQVNTKRDPKNFAFNWRTNPSSHLTNELIVGLNRFGFIFDSPGADLTKLAFAAPVAVPLADFGNSRKLNTLQFVDNVSYQWNAHALKFGTNLRFGREQDSRGSVGAYNAATDVYFNADIDNTLFNVPTSINQSNDLGTLRSATNFLLGRVGEVQRGFSAPDGQKFVTGLLPFEAHWNEYDFFAQYSWKVRRNLTIDLGLRWEIKMAPSSPNPVISHPSQALVAGATPTNSATWVQGSLFKSSFKDLGPSIGIAWDPFETGKTSVRANYRIAYDRLNSFLLSSQVFNNLPGLIYSFDDSTLAQRDTRLNSVSPVAPPSGVNPANFKAPAAFSTASIAVLDPNFKIPTTHQWDLSFQREIWKGGVFEADYVGRRGYHLTGAYNANQPNLFATGVIDAFNTVKLGGQSDLLNNLFSADSRVVAGKTASDMIRSQYSSQLGLNSFAAIYGALGTRTQATANGPRNVTSLSGASPFAVIPFPQFAGGVTVIDSNDFSTYNGLVLQYQQRYKSGIFFQVSYTLSKALATRDFDPTFTVVGQQNAQSASSTPFDIYNRKLNYGEPQYDHRHAFQGHATIELPFGRGKMFGRGTSGLVDRLIGGWEVSPIFTYYSGRPFTVYSGSDTFGSVVQSTANCSGCSHSLGNVQDYNGYKWFFNPDTDRQLFTAPAAGQLGNTGKGYFFGPRFIDIDMAFIKRVKIRESINLELRADGTNITNTPSFGLPTATITSSLFGRIGGGVESAARKFQMGAKLNF